MADDDDGYRHLIGTFKKLRLLPTNPTIVPVRDLQRVRDVEPPERHPRPVRPRELASVRDRPRARLPVLEHALRQRQQVRWYARCRRCGVAWSGRVLDVTQPAAVLATLAVTRIPCPVCWAQTWASTDQATRAAWALVRSWITPRWR